MLVNLSLKKMPGFGAEALTDLPTQIDLLTHTFHKKSGERQPFEPEQWPIMLFMKGFGFELIKFNQATQEEIEAWAERIAGYQKDYLFDPENFRVEDCKWSEYSENGKIKTIECQLSLKHIKKDLLHSIIAVPPLEAPLGVDSESSKKFVEEVERQTPQEILLRVYSILKEYEKDARTKDPELWACFLADVLAIALEYKFLEKAVEMAETHAAALSRVWSIAPQRTLRLFSAYDPKGTELFSWSRIFSSYPTIDLIRSFESNLSTPAGPQMNKLLNYRIQNLSDQMIELCFEENPKIQKSLLQWLSPHWREKHYSRILALLKEKTLDEKLTKLWVLALLRSSPVRAFEDLEEFFPKRGFFRRKFGNIQIQGALLEVLAEHTSPEGIQFIRKTKATLKGKLAGLAEKILGSHHKHSL